ncbi:UDP-2,4-diacetamido-2,4,6-trideoxy-beta-L-altropyranose hydrolase [Nitrospirillum pindoramense]|uniref:UDP-2,4-diacetamido-2,4, 6-trideoxy-beta-L-altropyranose hydrolase n=1 Tax=Nitrospirillum amazonense TaxID=28077 RepID=A0A560GYT8_9PROT|nr:UDP-2,4-diacetamido-2,4,6-trideoxy-beta-L-altropyranose hydrolase [Nitrospirillum amazonense]TWB38580.1 UDP-2,4-diacetamido-2,4,6-trideoxy-beta-L-altropyranose hydrolase [Nitrospirillum amazonense]
MIAPSPLAGPTVLIRADATASMGTGHVMRCLSVAEALAERGATPLFAAVDLPPALARRLDTAGFAVALLPGPASGPGDLAGLAAEMVHRGARAVILDGYHFTDAYRAGLAARMATQGAPVMAFDDGPGTRPLHAGLIVNPGAAVDQAAYRAANPDAVLALGPAYAPLRAEFRRARGQALPLLEQRRRLLLTFGGTDPAGLTLPCLKRLAPALPEGVGMDVVVGGSNPNTDCIRTAGESFPNTVVHVETPRMADLMRDAGLALSAAGGTLGELACLAVPILLVVVADNQASSAGAVAASAKARVIDARGMDKAEAAERITAATLALWADSDARAALSHRIADGQSVDGMGAVRIASALLDMAQASAGQA